MPQRMTTGAEDITFKQQALPDSLLEDVMDWIAENMAPEDVFDGDVLAEWALQSGFVEEE